jgi:hypothetical protein
MLREEEREREWDALGHFTTYFAQLWSNREPFSTVNVQHSFLTDGKVEAGKRAGPTTVERLVDSAKKYGNFHNLYR